MVKTAGFDSSEKVRERLQADLYHNRKRRLTRLAPPLFTKGTLFGASFKTGVYLSNGTISTAIGDVLTEDRTTDAYVLGGDGEYVLRFGSRTNIFTNSRRILGGTTNTATAVAYTGTTPFGDVGGRVYTSTGIIQTNNTIIADSAQRMYSRNFRPLSSGAKFTTAVIGLAGIDQASCVFDFDTLTTDSGRAPNKVETLSDGWVRLSWLFQNNGTGTILVWREDITADSDYASDQTDLTEGSTVYPPIITTGTAVTVPAEPAQADGHGLDGFDEVDNIITLLAAPTDLTGITFLQSGSGGTLTLEDQTTELGVIGLATLTGGKAYFVDNTSGDGAVFLSIANPTFDSVANDFNLSAILRGTSGVVLRTGGGDYTQIGSISETLFSRIETNNASRIAGGASTVDSFFVGVPVGEWAYVSLPQVVVGGDFHVPLVPPSSTRAADDTRVKQGENDIKAAVLAGDIVEQSNTSISGDVVTFASAAAFTGSLWENVSELFGQGVIVEYEVNLSAGSTRLILYSDTDINVGVTRTVNGTYTEVFDNFNAGGGFDNALYVQSDSAGATGTVTINSVKEITIAPGISANPNELTFRVDWDGVVVGAGAKFLFEADNPSGKTTTLFFSSGNDLRFGSNETGAYQLLNAGLGFDDGLPHTAVCYLNRLTGVTKISIDGGTTLSDTFVGAHPPNLNEMFISQRVALTDHLNGTNCQIQFTEGDFFNEYKAGVIV